MPPRLIIVAASVTDQYYKKEFSACFYPKILLMFVSYRPVIRAKITTVNGASTPVVPRIVNGNCNGPDGEIGKGFGLD